MRARQVTPTTTLYSAVVAMNNKKNEAKKKTAPQGPPEIDFKTLNAVVKKVLDYGPAKANRQSNPDR